ncbi:MAG: hypothetical protein EFT35_03120 [Methanophagales archaeon ANME-1-THS]|nr:MAG: hypothetical protein EFT35_03120 [Methanophagales archaeon ANME-1-THS]
MVCTRELHRFLSFLVRPKIVKASMISGTGLISGALIDAVVFLNILDKLTRGEVFEAALLLRLSYEATLLFIGYIILSLGFLWSTYPMLRNEKCAADSKKLQIQFVILLSFIISFLIARAFVLLLNVPINPAYQLWLKGYRVHHFFFGIAVLMIGGWLSHLHNGGKLTMISAALYGIGVGLVVDEFGLLLTFGDYWAAQSYLFFVIISLFFLIALLIEAYNRFTSYQSPSLTEHASV